MRMHESRRYESLLNIQTGAQAHSAPDPRGPRHWFIIRITQATIFAIPQLLMSAYLDKDGAEE